MPATVDSILKDVAAGKLSPVYLVTGDVVLAEPPARRLAQALAEKAGCDAVETHRRPARFGDILQDLCTYSLFGSGKISLVTDTAVLADERAAADLVDQAAAALPVEDPGAQLEGDQRAGASRLLLALHLFGLDAHRGTAADVVESLPKWALQGGQAYRKKRPRGRPAKEVAALHDGLVDLLDGARKSGLEGFAEGDLAELGEVVRKGLPDGHHLVLVEHSAAAAHPVVKTLKDRGALADAGKVTSVKGEWQVEALTAELARETGAEIARDAADELARRTLRQSGGWKDKQVDAESTARFAAEYRKLASLAGGGTITRRQVTDAVEDRGEEDVWQILDALGKGRGGDALARYQRHLASSDDTMRARLGFFGLLAGFCRQICAIAGVARIRNVPAGVQNYQQFSSRWAGKLKDDLPDADNPLSGLHPFRLHRAYLAASAFDRAEIARLPWRVLETEMRIKGESSEPDVAISELMTHVAASIGGSSKSGGRRPGRAR